MPKTKNSKEQPDFKKEWEKTKKQLLKLSKETAVFAKKAEVEIVRASKKGKLHIDASAATLKKEHLYHLIGKEYVKNGCPGRKTAKLKKLVADLENVDTQIKTLNTRIKSSK